MLNKIHTGKRKRMQKGENKSFLRMTTFLRFYLQSLYEYHV
jgi:hypothetical protein